MSNGKSLKEEDDIWMVVKSFFHSLLSKYLSLSLREWPGSSLEEHSFYIIDYKENKSRQAIPKEEVTKVVFSFYGDKVIGIDEFSLVFFQYFWDIFREDVVKAVQEFFASRNLLKNLMQPS